MTPSVDIVNPGLHVRQGYSHNTNANEAVRELAAQIHQPESKMCLAFFSDEYDRQELSRALQEYLPGPVIGCTTAGQLSSIGFQRGGISGISLASDQLIAVPYLIHPLSMTTSTAMSACFGTNGSADRGCSTNYRTMAGLCPTKSCTGSHENIDHLDLMRLDYSAAGTHPKGLKAERPICLNRTNNHLILKNEIHPSRATRP